MIFKCWATQPTAAESLQGGLSALVSEIVLKAVRAGAPVLASTAVATDLAVRMARQHGLTLLGNAKDEALWVYNNAGHLDLGLNPGPFPG